MWIHRKIQITPWTSRFTQAEMFQRVDFFRQTFMLSIIKSIIEKSRILDTLCVVIFTICQNSSLKGKRRIKEMLEDSGRHSLEI